MDLNEILGIDNTDPADRHAGYLVEADADLMAKLVEFRTRKNLSQTDVAREMGIDRSGVSKIESGYRDLLQSTIQRYAMAVGAVIRHEVVTFEERDADACLGPLNKSIHEWNPGLSEELRSFSTRKAQVEARTNAPDAYEAASKIFRTSRSMRWVGHYAGR